MEVNLRTLREGRGWGLEGLSIITGISAAQLSRAERGLSHLSPDARIRIARAFQLSPQQAREVPELAPDRVPA